MTAASRKLLTNIAAAVVLIVMVNGFMFVAAHMLATGGPRLGASTMAQPERLRGG